MENWQKILLAIVLAAGLGYASGRYVQPAKVEIQTKEVVKTVETVKHDTVTQIRTVKEKDGTVVTEKTITDKDVDQTNTVDAKSSETKIINEKPQWRVQGTAGLDLQNFTTPVYGIGVERRIIGPVFVGAWGNNHQTAGLSVSVEF